jgi:hypothetical protein
MTGERADIFCIVELGRHGRVGVRAHPLAAMPRVHGAATMWPCQNRGVKKEIRLTPPFAWARHDCR